MGQRFSLRGYEQLRLKVEGLGKAGKPIARSAVKKTLTVLKKGVQREAPVGKTKNAKKSIGASFKKAYKSDEVAAKVGANVGLSRRKQKLLGNHVRLIILGTKGRSQKTTGRYTGAVRKLNGFVKRGIRAATSAAADAFENGVKVALLRTLAKQ